jgi:hypothetical protein
LHIAINEPDNEQEEAKQEGSAENAEDEEEKGHGVWYSVISDQ